MNEFTKEELETLAACVSIYAKDEPDDYMPLFDKICSLINNYCEHKDTENIGGWCWKCTKCGMKFGDERY